MDAGVNIPGVAAPLVGVEAASGDDRAARETVAALVERARAGDGDALAALVRSVWPDLVAFARAVLASDVEAEDVVQDALIVAWRGLGTLRAPAAFPAWVRRIVFRAALRARRRERRQVPLEDVSEMAVRRAVGAVGAIDAMRALAGLSPRQRAVIYLGFIEGLTDGEVAAALGTSPVTVRIHRWRARRHLRRRLGGGT